MEKLKRCVIKQELVELTGCFKRAVTLQQMIYWSERVKDFDKFVREENMRVNNSDIDDKPIPLQHGWIYKNAEELSEETMMGVSPQTMLRFLSELVENGWLDRRRNPRYKWDKTYQYRVNLNKIDADLSELGYHLEGYSSQYHRISKMEVRSDENGTAIPEITTETTEPKGNFVDDKISVSVYFSEYESKTAVREDHKRAILYYLYRYQLYTNEQYHRHTSETWSRIVSSLLHVYDGDKRIDLSTEDELAMIDKHFETDYADCNYHLTHYVSDKVRLHRYYEVSKQ